MRGISPKRLLNIVSEHGGSDRRRGTNVLFCPVPPLISTGGGRARLILPRRCLSACGILDYGRATPAQFKLQTCSRSCDPSGVRVRYERSLQGYRHRRQSWARFESHRCWEAARSVIGPSPGRSFRRARYIRHTATLRLASKIGVHIGCRLTDPRLRCDDVCCRANHCEHQVGAGSELLKRGRIDNRFHDPGDGVDRDHAGESEPAQQLQPVQQVPVGQAQQLHCEVFRHRHSSTIDILQHAGKRGMRDLSDLHLLPHLTLPHGRVEHAPKGLAPRREDTPVRGHLMPVNHKRDVGGSLVMQEGDEVSQCRVVDGDALRALNTAERVKRTRNFRRNPGIVLVLTPDHKAILRTLFERAHPDVRGAVPHGHPDALECYLLHESDRIKPSGALVAVA
eukprot:scaffold14029_cov121-Isochrysis_galbana.AAC.12